MVRTGRTIQKLSKRGKVLQGASFNTLEDAMRLEQQYLDDAARGINVQVGIKREVYVAEHHQKKERKRKNQLAKDIGYTSFEDMKKQTGFPF